MAADLKKIERELRDAVQSALDNQGAFDLRKLSTETARALGRLEYSVARSAILTACSKDRALWARIAPLWQNPLVKPLLDNGVRNMHSELRRG